MTTRWREDKFEASVFSTIQFMGGEAEKIESKRKAGVADTMYSLDNRMGVIEFKSTAFTTRDGRIRLKHPLSEDQRKFIKRHGRCGSLAFVMVLLSDGVADNEAILFRWNEIEDLLDVASVEQCKMLASWHGAWPCRTEQQLRSFREVITGVIL